MEINQEILSFTFEKIGTMSESVVVPFLHLLKCEYPESHAFLSQIDESELAHGIQKEIMKIVTLFNSERRLIEHLENLGSKNLEYGILDHHYPVIGQYLLQSIAEAMGEHWNKSIELVWLQFIDIVAAGMITGVHKRHQFENVS